MSAPRQTNTTEILFFWINNEYKAKHFYTAFQTFRKFTWSQFSKTKNCRNEFGCAYALDIACFIYISFSFLFHCISSSSSSFKKLLSTMDLHIWGYQLRADPESQWKWTWKYWWNFHLLQNDTNEVIGANRSSFLTRSVLWQKTDTLRLIACIN